MLHAALPTDRARPSCHRPLCVALAVAVTVASFGSPRLALAQRSSVGSPFDDYEEALGFAENSFAFGDYDRVIRVLFEELYPTPPDHVPDLLLSEGFMYLGVSAHFEDNLDLARRAFLDLLRRDPTWELDPFVFPPEVISFFDALREEYADELPIQDEDDRGTVFIESRVREQSILVSILPFGYGLITNGETEWGVFYALTESALLATTVSMFWLNRRDRVPSDSLTRDFGYDDANLARRRQRVQIGTGVAFLALVAANVVHGALAHDTEKDVRYRTLERPPSEFDRMEERSSRPRWRLRVSPILELAR